MNKLYRSIKKRGIIGTTQRALQKALGLGKLQEEVDSLYYYINMGLDIRNIGPTKDQELRDVQICLKELLKIFHAECEKNNLKYWLDYGTLLGAVRNHGFIPWDDDVDVAMPRADFEKLMDYTKKELEQYGINVRYGGYFDNSGPLARIAYDYKTLQTGAWIDVFPIDYCMAQTYDESTVKKIQSCGANYRKFYLKSVDNLTVEEMMKHKEKFYRDAFDENGNVKILFHCEEFDGSRGYIPEEEVIPLQKMMFEDSEFWIPGNYDMYLRILYGDSYMDFPRIGLEHHIDPDGGLVKTRASRTGTDMKKEIEYLRGIYRELKRGICDDSHAF